MSEERRFKVLYDPNDYEEIWSKTPFNYKKDAKPFSEDDLKALAEEVSNEILYGIERPPITAALHWSSDRNAASAKIRTLTLNHDTGKSGGYRCVVLVDYVNNAGYILHIYKHNKEADAELQRHLRKKDNKSLKHLVDEYSSSLNKS